MARVPRQGTKSQEGAAQGQWMDQPYAQRVSRSIFTIGLAMKLVWACG